MGEARNELRSVFAGEVVTEQARLRTLSARLDEAVAEATLDAEVPARDVVVVGRRDVDDLALLHMDSRLQPTPQNAHTVVTTSCCDSSHVPSCRMSYSRFDISAPVGHTAMELPQ